MPQFRIRDIGRLGVIKDMPPYDLQPNAFSDAMNVRFKGTHVEKMGGYIPVYTKNKPDGIPLAVFERPNSRMKIYGSESGVYLIDNDAYNNALPAGMHVTATATRPWYYTTMSNTVVMSNSHDNPIGMTPATDVFQELPNWGVPNKPIGSAAPVKQDWKCRVMRSYKSYLLALNMTEQTIEYPQRVRWSNEAQLNNLPPDWYQDQESTDGGFNDLMDCMGTIQDGAPLRDSFVIYTNRETYVMNYVGGAAIFNFSKLFSDTGLLAPNCVAEFDGKHFVVAQSDIFVHNGSDKTPVAVGRVKQYLMEEISRINPTATQVIAVPSNKEIWICYVGSGGDTSAGQDLTRTCNTAAIWNWEFDTWSFTELPNMLDINAITVSADVDQHTWASMGTDDWPDEATEAPKLWRGLGQDFVKQVITVCSEDGCMYALDYGTTQNIWDDTTKAIKTSNPVISRLERIDLDMDEVVEDTRRYKTIRQVTPQIYGGGKIELHIGGSMNPNGVASYFEFSQFDMLTDTKFDTFANARYPALKFTDSTGLGIWKFTGYDLDYFEGGTTY